MEKVAWFRSVCEKNGLSITETQLDLIDRYVGLLLDWNKKINLISRRDEANVWERHILHSIAMLFKLDPSLDASVLDLGAGGGLPGVPIKIVSPSVELTCLESVKKKTVALENMLKELSITDVNVVWGRAEELATRNSFCSQFDYVICRAVAPLDKLAKWSAPLLRKSHASGPDDREPTLGNRLRVPCGSLIAWKGGELERELTVTRKLKSVGSVTVIPLVFRGSETIEATDKHLVVVSMN